MSLWIFLPPADAGEKEISAPAGSHAFAKTVTVLTSGNFVVTDPDYEGPGGAGNAGAAYLYNGATLEIISALSGQGGDMVGSGGVRVLANGNYVVISHRWNAGRGAVTWGHGDTGISGLVSEANSLVGAASGDSVGVGGVTALKNGNYVVSSAGWNEGRGAVTWASGTSGITGLVSSENSLVGNSPEDGVGGGGITELTNGNYVVRSWIWNQVRGAVTWGSGVRGVTGEVSAQNSLIGTNPRDQVGETIHSTLFKGVTPLDNGNYLVLSSRWNQQRGAVTWGNGLSGTSGELSAVNSLVGRGAGDSIGVYGVRLLKHGDYVVVSGSAVTWASGAAGIAGEVSAANSLVGSGPYDYPGRVVELSNGNYVVSAANWNHSRGAVMWCNGKSGLVGEVSSSNALVGGREGDEVGNPGVVPLANGGYVVLSKKWNGERQAVTWGSASGIVGTVSEDNSLVGTEQIPLDLLTCIPLANGNFVVSLSAWNGLRGAVVWGSGTSGLKGSVSASNALLGSRDGDYVGWTVTPLTNGNYVVCSPYWNGRRGAATWCSGASGITGTVEDSNSLVGDGERFMVGSSGVVPLGNGNFLVRSEQWGESRGAVTWGNGFTGITGTVSASNSLVGRTPLDLDSYGIRVWENGNFIIPNHSHGHGYGPSALTWGDGALGVSGQISAANSLVAGPYPFAFIRESVSLLPDGNYMAISIVGQSPSGLYAGAVTLTHGGRGISGTPSQVNSSLGSFQSGENNIVAVHDALNHRIISGWTWEKKLRLFGYEPEISVMAGEIPVMDDDHSPESADRTDFGGAAMGGSPARRTFVIRNSGMEPLHLGGSPAVVVTGDHAADFTVTVNLGPEVEAVGSAAFEVAFTPAGAGLRRAVVSIASDDGDEAVFDFAVQGRGWTEAEAEWRAAHFGTATQGTGMLDDFDGDGVGNLLEFAFGTPPADRSGGPAPLQYSGPLSGGGTVEATGQPVTLRGGDGDEDFHAAFARRRDFAAAGLTYRVQFSPDLVSWQDDGTEPAVLADDGGMQIVSVPYPQPEAGQRARFFRVKVGLAS